MLANVAYLNVLSPDEIAATDRVAALVAERAFGSAGGTIVSLTILISILGALNAGILAGPRVYFAQARDGLFFRKFGEVHPRFETPGLAVLLQGVWAAILSLGVRPSRRRGDVRGQEWRPQSGGSLRSELARITVTRFPV